MPSSIDPAIIKALSLQDASPVIQSHGGSGFSATFKIRATVDGKQKSFFIKTGRADSELMFTGEHASLNAIHDSVPSFIPRSYAHGALENSNGFFLATEFVNFSSTSRTTGASLAQKLAQLHTTPVPPPEGYSTPQFGFPVPTCCGSTVQPNDYAATWEDFFANQRLRAIGNECVRQNGRDKLLMQLVEDTAKVVVPRLLGEGHLKTPEGKSVAPVVVHGDLWAGNHGTGKIDDGPVENMVFDPSASWSHSEFDIGIMRMFGGFAREMEEYHKLKPKDQPTAEYNDRVDLYEVYHHLNHYAMFGGGYKSSAIEMMKKLVVKYDGTV